jgi:hypothetical protein
LESLLINTDKIDDFAPMVVTTQRLLETIGWIDPLSNAEQHAKRLNSMAEIENKFHNYVEA